MRLNHIIYKPPGQIAIEKDLDRLGIEVDMDWGSQETKSGIIQNIILVGFNSQEDMNLYRMLGTVKENHYIKFEVKD